MFNEINCELKYFDSGGMSLFTKLKLIKDVRASSYRFYLHWVALSKYIFLQEVMHRNPFYELLLIDPDRAILFSQVRKKCVSK